MVNDHYATIKSKDFVPKGSVRIRDHLIVKLFLQFSVQDVVLFFYIDIRVPVDKTSASKTTNSDSIPGQVSQTENEFHKVFVNVWYITFKTVV